MVAKVKLAKIEEVSLTDYSQWAMTRYGIETLKYRATASLIDGLKPVQRRILWSAYELGLKPKGTHKKSARIVGDVIGRLHPHGDEPIYGALVNMVNAPEPNFDGQGNFGTATDTPAAMRYTEARISTFGWSNYFQGDYTNLIRLVDTYDSNDKEPVALPSNTLALLVNGSFGVSVGAQSSVPSFTLASVNALLVKALKKRLTVKDVIDTLHFKLEYGGKFQRSPANKAAFTALANNGIGSIEFLPGYKLDPIKKQIAITQLVNSIKSGNLVAKVAAHSDVHYYDDQSSDKVGIRHVIQFKKDVKFDEAWPKIVKLFSGKESYRINYLIERVETVNGEDVFHVDFKSTGIIEMVHKWLDWRRDLERRLIKYQVSQMNKQLARLNLLLLAYNQRDILDACRDTPDPKAHLIKHLKVTDDDANYLLDLKVRQLTKLFNRDLKAEIKALKMKIASRKADIKIVDKLLAKAFGGK